jgi:hypothetical protein
VHGSLGILIILSCCLAGQAQSGRRSPKPLSPPTSTAPTTTPATKEAEPTAPAEKPAIKQQNVIVAMDDRSSAYYIPAYMTDAVMRGFTSKFNGVASIKLTVDTKMRRKEAVERAKKETETFFILLQLSTDNMGGEVNGDVNPEALIVTYYVFTPGTGKVKDQSRIYIRPAKSILGQRVPTSASTVDAQLVEAGREAAYRAMSALHTDTPTIRR